MYVYSRYALDTPLLSLCGDSHSAADVPPVRTFITGCRQECQHTGHVRGVETYPPPPYKRSESGYESVKSAARPTQTAEKCPCIWRAVAPRTTPLLHPDEKWIPFAGIPFSAARAVCAVPVKPAPAQRSGRDPWASAAPFERRSSSEPGG